MPILTLVFQMINSVSIFPLIQSAFRLRQDMILSSWQLRTLLNSPTVVLWQYWVLSSQCYDHQLRAVTTVSPQQAAVLYLDFGVILNTVPPCTDSLVSGPASAEVKSVSAFPPKVLRQQYKQPVNVLIRAKVTLEHTLLPLQLPDKLPATLTEETRETKCGSNTACTWSSGLLFRCYLDKMWSWANINCRDWNNAASFVPYVRALLYMTSYCCLRFVSTGLNRN